MKKIKKILLFFFFFLFFSVANFVLITSANADTCNLKTETIKVNEICEIDISKLHPTQAKIGLYQVNYDIELLKLINEGKSSKYKTIKDYLKAKIVPVVIGDNNIFYMVDRHHTIRAIWDYFDSKNKPKIPIKIVQNWSSKKDFWQQMKSNNYTYLGVGKDEINPSQLPKNIGELTNDNYRSAIGLAVNWTFLKEPKGEEKYFYQFKWGNCLQKLGFNLPAKIQRDEVYATAAFLHDEKNQTQFKNSCNLTILESESFDDMIQVLED